jgi:abhydrolase domain-containing protein 12
LELVKALAATMEAHVVAVDYRGFGDSSGWPSEAGLAEDAKAVYRWVEERVMVGGRGGGGGGGGVNVYVYGQSLGSSVALGLAHHLSLSASSSQPPQQQQQNEKKDPTNNPLPLAGIILDAPFTNLTMAALHHPSALPFRILPFVKQALLHSMHEKYPSIDLITNITQPILIIHGRKDRMIPFSLGQELYQAARLARVRTRPALLDDVWFSEVGEGTHHNNYAHPQWTYDLVSFMRTMDGQGQEVRGKEKRR